MIENLPWINIEDKDAELQVVPFLSKTPLIVEAGAAAGEDTLKFKDIWPESIVHCFEPNPDLRQICREAIASEKNPFHPDVQTNKSNIFLYPFALSDSEGERVFYKSKAHAATSSLFPDNSKNVVVPESILQWLNTRSHDEAMPSKQDEPIKVQCTTLDIWAEKEKVTRIDYLWLDAEGSELLILKGAQRMLPTIRAISIELNSQEFRVGGALFDDVYNYIINNGFSIHAIWKAHDNWQANAIFINKGVING